MKKVLVTGGSGFLGRKLVAALHARGDEAVVLTRDPAAAQRKVPAGVRCVAWGAERRDAWAGEVATADAIVHLAGEPAAQRWTPAVRARIVSSRVDSARALVDAMRASEKRPAVFVCASAIGYYGARPPQEELDEESAPGTGFLADVCTRWEAEARAAAALGVRDVELRLGVVLGEGGGAVDKMVLPFRLFAGGPIGSGEQVVSWIHGDDALGILLLALDDERARGPINVVSPRPVSSADLARAMGKALGRPAWIATPAFAVKLALGEAAEAILTGQRVLPKRAIELGYTFRQPEIGPALAAILGRG